MPISNALLPGMSVELVGGFLLPTLVQKNEIKRNGIKIVQVLIVCISFICKV